MNPDDVRRMVAGWQAVEEREREERRKAGPDSAAAVQGALELMDLFGEMHGWPPPENEARRRDDELARERWVRVRNFYRAHGKTAQPVAAAAVVPANAVPDGTDPVSLARPPG